MKDAIDIEIGLKQLISGEELTAYKELVISLYRESGQFYDDSLAKAKDMIEGGDIQLGQKDGVFGVQVYIGDDIEKTFYPFGKMVQGIRDARDEDEPLTDEEEILLTKLLRRWSGN